MQKPQARNLCLQVVISPSSPATARTSLNQIQAKSIFKALVEKSRVVKQMSSGFESLLHHIQLQTLNRPHISFSKLQLSHHYHGDKNGIYLIRLL